MSETAQQNYSRILKLLEMTDTEICELEESLVYDGAISSIKFLQISKVLDGISEAKHVERKAVKALYDEIKAIRAPIAGGAE